MAEEVEVIEGEKAVKLFDNNLDDGLKDRIRTANANRVEEILDKAQLSSGDIATLAGVSYGSVKARAKSIADAAGIVDAILSGARTSTKKAPSVESVKSFLDSLSPEEKEKFLAELNH